MKIHDTIFAFDLDGTVTKQEILPVLAKELNLYDEMSLLTKLTLDGSIDFKQSFRLRVEILKSIPISRIQEIVADIQLDSNIEAFIKQNRQRCVIVTGNLDVWIAPIIKRLECVSFSSIANVDGDRLLSIQEILLKNKAIFETRNQAKKVVAIGESYNDISMFTEADLGVAFGGIHDPVDELIQVSNYVVYDGGALCNLLETL
ncbi:HAD-IB family phosphatase [Desulfuribacillus alkaliarsenatis]|uniref:phosphoserine phosphatase n=1 Tax=Desulfuribacillus alkaliarsenatis TaxID=766136 RepID=A0A1E5G3R6_9FIRM|nr:HAD-IB family phosphatase [Desulfuribacillus alkaliarsenatis]OEF97720.1 hypothetical protein BHF68_14070 [Desulfuribacillus alkaliarsenatis]